MNGQQSGTDWIGLIMASNEAALQWAQLFTGRTMPGQTTGVLVDEHRTEVGGGGLVLIAVVVIAAIFLLKD